VLAARRVEQLQAVREQCLALGAPAVIAVRCDVSDRLDCKYETNDIELSRISAMLTWYTRAQTAG